MSRPLDGLRVVVTRPADKAQKLTRALSERGAEVVSRPMISIVDPPSWTGVDDALSRLRDGAYDWVVFTSVNAVEKVLVRLADRSVFASAKIAAVGGITREALIDHGIGVDLVPEDFTGEALASALGEGSGSILLPRVEGAPRSTVSALEQRGWSIDEVVAYKNVAPDTTSEPVLDADGFDVVTFASGSAARNFATTYDLDKLAVAAGTETDKIVACIGPKTAEDARAAGIRVDVVASVHTDEGLVAALEERVASRPHF